MKILLCTGKKLLSHLVSEANDNAYDCFILRAGFEFNHAKISVTEAYKDEVYANATEGEQQLLF